MGARPPLETDSVSVGRYGLPVRKRYAAGLLVLLLAACSGGSGAKQGGGNKSGLGPCPLIAMLDQTAAQVASADVSDPAAFQKTLSQASTQYISTIRALKPLVPATVQPDLDRVEAAVHQRRYQDALVARSSLDQYTATECRRVASATVPVTTPATGAGVTTTTTAQ